MTDEPANLVLEHLRGMRGDMTRMADYMHGLQTEMIALRQHLASGVTLQEHDHGDLAAIKARQDRIERRLELVD